MSGRLPPSEIYLPDNRAHRLLIIHSSQWYLIPSCEVFSRHSGVCLVLGDKYTTNTPLPIRLGDCFRFGSVGLVVSEIKYDNDNEQRLDSKTLQYLKDEASAIDHEEDLAALAAEENEGDSPNKRGSMSLPSSPENSCHSRGLGLTNGERFICYMCYETHDTPEDPLVAPCECKGDTRYLHVQCMQKWYYANASATHAQVIRTTSNGAAACKICGAAYKSAFKKADGKRASLLETNPDGPYISLVVVTKHDSNPTLFNTKFRLSFGSGTTQDDLDDRAPTLLIGRSSTCNMILDYRTVSTVHAKLSFNKKQFFLEDCGSSNGTMVYLREPVPLPYNKTIKIRNGRSTLSFAARRSWAASFRDAVFSRGNNCTSIDPEVVSRSSKFFGDNINNSTPTPEQLMSLMVATSSLSTSIKSRNNSPGHVEKDITPNTECRPCEPFTQLQVDNEEFDDFADVIADTDENLKQSVIRTKSLDISGLDSSPTYLPHSINAPPARILGNDVDMDVSCTNAGHFAIRRPGSPNKSSGPNSENNSPIRISRIDINTDNGDNNDDIIVNPSSTNSYNSNYYSDQSNSTTNTSRTNEEKEDKGATTITTINSKEVDTDNKIETINPSSSSSSLPAYKDSNSPVNEI